MTEQPLTTEQIRSRIQEIKTMRFGDVLPHPRNPKVHPQNQREAFRGVVRELGFVSVPLAYHSERTGGLTWADGHLRGSEVADYVGEVAILDIDDKEADYMLVTADPVAAMATADAAALDALLHEVNSSSAAVMDMLAALAEDAGLYLEPTTGAGGDEFDTTPQEGETRAQRGDLWQMGEHRLLVDDCTVAANVARLMGGEKAAIAFTSPPYNIGTNAVLSFTNAPTGDTKYATSRDDLSSGEYFDFLCSFTDAVLSAVDYLFLNIQQLAKNKIVLIDYLHRYRLHFADVMVWNKGNGQPSMADNVLNSDFEFIYVIAADEKPTRAIGTAAFRGTVSNVYSGPPQRGNEFADVHSATFPLHLPEHFVQRRAARNFAR